MIRIAVVPALAALCCIAVPAGAQTVTAEWSLDTPGGSFGSFGGALVNARGQTFFAIAAGRAHSVALRIGRLSDHDTPLRLLLHEVDENGIPVGLPLVFEDYPAGMFPADGTTPPVSLIFSQAVPVLAAEARYALVVRPSVDAVEGNLYVLNGTAGEGEQYVEGASCYRIGSEWMVLETTDWSFRVQVDAESPIETLNWGALKVRGHERR